MPSYLYTVDEFIFDCVGCGQEFIDYLVDCAECITCFFDIKQKCDSDCYQCWCDNSIKLTYDEWTNLLDVDMLNKVYDRFSTEET